VKKIIDTEELVPPYVPLVDGFTEVPPNKYYLNNYALQQPIIYITKKIV